MSEEPPFAEQVHFRAPNGFMQKAKEIAGRKGMRAASWMRMTILEAIDREDSKKEQ